MPGRERHPQPAQPADAAGRRGPRRAQLVAIHQRGHRPVRRPHRRRVRLAPLADLGCGRGRHADDRAARPLRVPARPDPAPDEPGPCRQRDRRGDRDAPGPRRRVAHHGYYGSVSHNVKAIYQRYLGWYDGNPAHLWQHPPEAAADRYVRIIGGIDATVARAREFADAGDLRFAAELASHAVFAEPSHDAARALLADVFTRLGHGAECGTWRNNYLTGAQELRGMVVTAGVSSAGMVSALTITQLFDSLAIRIDGKRAWDATASVRWHFTDTGETYRMDLSNGVLTHHPTTRTAPADLVVTLTRAQLLGMLAGAGPNGVQFDGDPKTFAMIVGFADDPDPSFAIVTP
ncbi:alkyl sulfatase dimerization domain-containing protein [Pseudonocardia halophobica]|uniref:alkyl sulfatase dimerization domain-containing protein n=1 Tax=Pseudonocardia halophobica TaxID=29401 RepID=UPI003D8C8419